MSEHTIKIENGCMEFVYSDELVPLLDIGNATVTRASHVEPHPTRNGWLADMRPSGGPILGFGGVSLQDSDLGALQPFTLREDALAAERAWLAEHKGL